MLCKYINVKIFFVSLCLGLFIVYLIQPKPKIVLKCPNPENENSVTYKDKTLNECFKYKSELVDCPSDEKTIKTCSLH